LYCWRNKKHSGTDLVILCCWRNKKYLGTDLAFCIVGDIKNTQELIWLFSVAGAIKYLRTDLAFCIAGAIKIIQEPKVLIKNIKL